MGETRAPDPKKQKERPSASRSLEAPGVSIEKHSGDADPPAQPARAPGEPGPAAASATESAPAPAPATIVAPVQPPEPAVADGGAGEALADAEGRRRSPGRRAEDRESPERGARLRVAVPTVEPGSRTENIIAVFLFGIIAGCAGIWIEHNRCPGALKTAALAGAPIAVALAVPVAVAIAWFEKGATRALKTRRAILFGIWAAAAAIALDTAGLLWWNERGPVTAVTQRCWVSRRETVPAPSSGVSDWILVISCSDRMSLVRVDVDRARWWENEPGTTVDAKLDRGRLGFDWVVDFPALGPPKRSL